MNTTNSNETHEALVSTSDTLELSDEMLMMISGGGEESQSWERDSFLGARVREAVNAIADAFSGSSPEPGPSDGARGTGSSSGRGGAGGY